MNKSFVAILMYGLVFPAQSQAAYIDFSTVTLAGTAPEYTFTDATFGDVTINYSGDYKLPGITTQFGAVSALGLGELDNGPDLPGSVTLSWTNSVTSFDLRYYDLDLAESATFTLASGVSMSLLSSPLGNVTQNGNVLKSTNVGIGNNNTSNFAEVRIQGDAFNSITIDFIRPGTSGGGSSLGFGNGVSAVPVPAAIWLFGSGLLGLTGLAKRKNL